MKSLYSAVLQGVIYKVDLGVVDKVIIDSALLTAVWNTCNICTILVP